MHTPDTTINVVGQSCPMPLIELAKTVKAMQPGQLLKISGDDPIFEISVRDFCTALQLEVVSVTQDTQHLVSIVIRC